METWGVEASTWDVIGILLTAGALLAGGVAALVAALQYRASQDARLDQSRPYVILTAAPSPASRAFIDLVLANVGNGPAYDVTIDVDPPFVTSKDENGFKLKDARVFNQPIPMLPPHYDVRMFFDSALERGDRDDLPERFEARISYNDGHGHRWTDELSTIDAGLQKGMLYTEIYGVHHAAKALREIQKDTKKLASSAGVVEATVETRADREQRDAEARERHEEMVRKFEERQQQEQVTKAEGQAD